MIVKMKKLTILCARADQDRALEALRELGVLHVTHVQGPEGEDLEKARARLSHLHRTLELIPARSEAAPTGGDPAAAVEAIWGAALKRKELEAGIELLEREYERLEPIGDFDPASVAQLAKQGVFVRLYHTASRETPIVPAATARVLLHRNRNGAIWAVFSRAPLKLDLTEFRMPEHSLGEVRQRLAAQRDELGRQQAILDRHAGDHAMLATYAREAEQQVAFLEARTGMGLEGPIAYIEGYAPAESVARVRAEAAQRCWAVLEADPASGDPVPSLVRNPGWIKPIKTVLDFIGITPGYEEIDISAAFLLFLSLFFAMLVGDAGYGALFMILTFVARRKMPHAPAHPFRLMYLMSAATVVWGVITGTYFGAAHLPAVLEQLKINWLTSEGTASSHIMLLCFTIGASHLTVAHLWNALRARKTPQALAQLGWIGTTWTMFFLARMMVLNETLPGFVMPLFWASVAAIILFMTPPGNFKAEWFNHVMLPLSLVSNFVDVVSYLRLFAVGTASFAVADAFNTMALAGVHDWWGGLVAALILFFGHALNVLLSAMGVLVHGVRLNTLEFSSHIGMQWSGIPYRPFSRAGVPGDVRKPG